MTAQSILARLMWVVGFAQRNLLTLVAIAWFAILATVVREAWTSRDEHTNSRQARHVEIAGNAAGQIANFLSDIETQARSTLLPLGDDWREANRLAAQRLFRGSPAVRSVYRLSADGAEQHRISQIEVDRDRSGEHWARRWPKFGAEPVLKAGTLGQSHRLVPAQHTTSGGTTATEHLLEIALTGHAPEFGFTIVEVNLRLLWDEVRKIRVGPGMLSCRHHVRLSRISMPVLRR